MRIRAQEYFGIIQESQRGAFKHLILLGALYLSYFFFSTKGYNPNSSTSLHTLFEDTVFLCVKLFNRFKLVLSGECGFDTYSSSLTS